MKLTRHTLILLLMLYTPCVSFGTEIAEIKEAWGQQLQLCQNVAVEFQTTATISSDREKKQLSSGKVQQYKENLSAKLDKDTRVLNSKYFFIVSETANRGLVLVSQGSPGDEKLSRDMKIFNALLGSISPFHTIAGVNLIDHLDSFHVTSETKDTITLASSNKIQSKIGMNACVIYDIQIVLDKSHLYAIIEGSCKQIINKSNGEVSVHRSTTNSKVAAQQWVELATEKFAGTNDHLTIETKTTYEFSYGKIESDAAFRLSAFGFPEPVGVVWTHPMTISFWIWGGGIVFLILAIFFCI